MKQFIPLTMLIFILASTLQRSAVTSADTGLFNMSYLFFSSVNSYVSQVDKTKGSLDVVAPNYFDITTDGKLDITWKLQSSFITEMHNRGIRVVPFLANHWNQTAGINGLNNRDQLARDVAAAINQYQLDGVNVDIEGVGSAYREAHTDFIRLLRKYIPDHKEVSVAVAANPNGWKTGWHGFYDYKALSNYASYIMIMAYDESWESPESPIGPVSSLPFFEKSIQYAINQGVPKTKIVVGLPFYGRMWKLDGPTLDQMNITGKGVSSTQIGPVVSKFNGKIQYDEQAQSAYATFTIPNGESWFIGSTKLTKGNYIIWYDNERAIKAKLHLPSKYGIKGTGSWALYHETPETWDYYTLWLNKHYFVDVPIGYWAESSINLVSQKGWMNGFTSISFSPGTTLTRAQGAVILVRAMGYSEQKPQSYKFKDLIGHWGQDEIEMARELGYLEGKTPQKFDADAPLTRKELAKILYSIFDYPVDESLENPFPDVAIDHWSYKPILAMYQQGIIGGFLDGTFRPNSISKRSQMAALMERMASDFENAGK